VDLVFLKRFSAECTQPLSDFHDLPKVIKSVNKNQDLPAVKCWILRLLV